MDLESVILRQSSIKVMFRHFKTAINHYGEFTEMGLQNENEELIISSPLELGSANGNLIEQHTLAYI